MPLEGGFLGPNSLPTVRACLISEQEHVHSFSWRLRDNTLWGDAFPFWLGRERESCSVDEFVYWGGLIHGAALTEYALAFRRKMFDCAAAVFWMYNDVWPCTRSWIIVDYGLRRTPAFQPIRRSFAPIALAVAEEADEIRIIGINDTAETVSVKLRYGIFEMAGAYRRDDAAGVELAPNASTVLASFPASDYTDRERMMAFAVLSDSAGTVFAGPSYLMLSGKTWTGHKIPRSP